MIAADASVLVPALLADHEFHEACHESAGLIDSAVGHALVETYAVLTRLPQPYTVPRAASQHPALADHRRCYRTSAEPSRTTARPTALRTCPRTMRGVDRRSDTRAMMCGVVRLAAGAGRLRSSLFFFPMDFVVAGVELGSASILVGTELMAMPCELSERLGSIECEPSEVSA